MIRVHKPTAPKALTRRADADRRKLEAAYDMDPAAYREGRKKLKIREDTYGHSDVRRVLAEAQHRKCCFCEAKVEPPQAVRHVEHFRPKRRVRQWTGEEAFLPGYYWLAYEWLNLYMACHFCNSMQKGDQFPMADPTERPRDHHESDRISREVALMLDPGADVDFALHIRFVRDRPEGLTPEGRATVKAVGLADPVHEGRLKHLAELEELLIEIDALSRVIRSGFDRDEIVDTHRRLVIRFDAFRKPEAPYSAMVRDYLASATRA